jgi:predicted RNase H-like HicB family nuclease
MKSEFTAIIEPAPEGGFWAICPEIPGANGQGETVEETKQNLIEAIELLLDSVVVWCGCRFEGAGVLCGGVCGVEVQREWGRLL